MEAVPAEVLDENAWLTGALRSIASTGLSRSARKEAIWLAMKASMGAPSLNLQVHDGSWQEHSHVTQVASLALAGEDDSEDHRIVAEIHDRMQCIRAVVQNAVLESHGRGTMPLAHVDILRRNVALHAFGQGISMVSTLSESQLRHAQKGTLMQMDRFDRLEAELQDLKLEVSASQADSGLSTTNECSSIERADSECSFSLSFPKATPSSPVTNSRFDGSTLQSAWGKSMDMEALMEWAQSLQDADAVDERTSKTDDALGSALLTDGDSTRVYDSQSVVVPPIAGSKHAIKPRRNWADIVDTSSDDDESHTGVAMGYPTLEDNGIGDRKDASDDVTLEKNETDPNEIPPGPEGHRTRSMTQAEEWGQSLQDTDAVVETTTATALGETTEPSDSSTIVVNVSDDRLGKCCDTAGFSAMAIHILNRSQEVPPAPSHESIEQQISRLKDLGAAVGTEFDFSNAEIETFRAKGVVLMPPLIASKRSSMNNSTGPIPMHAMSNRWAKECNYSSKPGYASRASGKISARKGTMCGTKHMWQPLPCRSAWINSQQQTMRAVSRGWKPSFQRLLRLLMAAAAGLSKSVQVLAAEAAAARTGKEASEMRWPWFCKQIVYCERAFGSCAAHLNYE